MKKPTKPKKFRRLKKRLVSVGTGKPINLMKANDEPDDWPTDDDDPPARDSHAEKDDAMMSNESGDTSAGTTKLSKLKKRMKLKKQKKLHARKLRTGAKPKATGDECPRTDIDFGNSLWECIEPGQAGEWLARQQDTLNAYAARGFRRNRIADQLRSQANALLFETGSIAGASIVDDSLMMAAYERLRGQLIDYLARNPDDDLLFVTLVPGEAGTSLDRPVIALKELKQKANAILRKLGPNHFGMLDISCFSNIRHENGGRHMQPHVHALVFGPGIAARSSRVVSKELRKLTHIVMEIDPLQAIPVTDKSAVNLERLSAYLVKPPAKCKNWYRRDDGRDISNHSSANTRFIRYTRLAQIRSLLSFEDAALAGGDGVAIRGSLVTGLRGLAKAAARSMAAMHPDALPSFWAEFNHAIGKDRFAVPVILRK